MNQLKAGSILNYCVIILNIIVGLLYTPYMIRTLGQSEYGLYSMVSSIIMYLTVLDLGLGNAVVRYTAKFRAEGKVKEQYEMFGMFLIVYLIISFISIVIGLTLYWNVDKLFGDTMSIEEIKNAKIMMLILVFNLGFTFPMSIFGSIMSAYEKFVFPKLINITRTILNTVIMIIMLSLGFKAIAMVVLITIFNFLTLTINFIYCKCILKIEIHFVKFKWDFFREVLIYSFWIFLNSIMDRIYWSSGQFVLGHIAGTIAVAIFAVAIQMESMYMTFSTAISSVFLPKVTALVTQNTSNKDISKLFIKIGRIQNIVMTFILLGFTIFGQQFIILWAGEEYQESYLMTLLFFCSLYIPLIQNLGITILQARNQMKFRSILYISIALIALILEFIFGKKYGGLGCAAVIAGALLLGQGVVMNIYYYKKQNIDIIQFWKEIIKMNLAPVIIAIPAYYIVNYVLHLYSWMSLCTAIAIFGLIYIPICIKFSLNQYECDLILKSVMMKIRK